MATVSIGSIVLEDITTDKVIKINKEDISNLKGNLSVELPEGSSYQVLMSEQPAGDVIVKVTNADGTTFEITFQNLATIYEEAIGTEAGDIIAQLMITVNGESLTIANYAELLEALEATAAGEGSGQNGATDPSSGSLGIDPSGLGSGLGDNPDGFDRSTLGDTIDTNARPTVVDVSLLAIELKDGMNVITGQLVASDTDANDTHTFNLVPGTFTVTSSSGVITIDDDEITLEFNEDGSFTISGDFNDLAVGENATVSFDYTATDSGNPALTSEPATVTLNVTGTNDQPVVEDVSLNGGFGESLVGYYDMAEGSGTAIQQEILESANFTISDLEDLTAENLQNVSTLYIDKYGSNTEFTSNLDAIHEAVFNGMTLFINDGTPSEANTILPGLTQNLVNSSYSNKDINIGPDGEELSTGIGGTLDDTSLDNGSSSAHGAFESSSLPDGAKILLTSTNPNEVIAFSYDYGSGTVVYSTMPLMAYFDPDWIYNTTNPVLQDFIEAAKIYVQNSIEDNNGVKVLYETYDDTDVIGVDDTTEDGNNIYTGQLTVFDDDDTDTHTFHMAENGITMVDTPVNSEGQAIITLEDLNITINLDGTYNVGGDFSELRAGETATITVEYYALDDNGLEETDIHEASESEHKLITFTITGTNDQPVVENVNLNNTTEYTIEQTHTITTEAGGTIGFTYFTVSEAGTVTITSDGPTIDPNMYLLKNDGDISSDDIIRYNDDGWTPAGAWYNSIISEYLEPGQYIVAVSDYYLSEDELINNFNYDSDALMTGDVTLTLTSTTPITVENIVYETNEIETVYEGQLEVIDDDVNDTHTFQLVSSNVVTNSEAEVTNLEVILDKNTGEFSINGNFDQLAVGEKATVTFTYTATDDSVGSQENNTSEPKTVTLVVTGTNDAPTIDLVETVSYTEQDGGRNWILIDPTITMNDVDHNSTVKSLTISIADELYDARLQLGDNNSDAFKDLSSSLKIVDNEGTEYTANANGNIWWAAGTSLTITKLDGTNLTEEEAEIVMQAVKFSTGDRVPVDAEDITIEFSVTDDQGATTTSSIEVDVTGTNDTPILTSTLQNDQTALLVDEDATLIVNTQIDMGLAYSDNDEKGTLTLKVEEGILNIDMGDVYASYTVTGNGTNEVTIEGYYYQINGLLSGSNNSSISYTGDADYYGDDLLTVTFNDDGDLGLDAKQATIEIPIVVDSVPDASWSGYTLTENNGQDGLFEEESTLNASFNFESGDDAATITSLELLHLHADGRMHWKWTQEEGHSYLQSNGEDIIITQDGLNYIGKVGEVTIFTMTVTDVSTGDYTFTQFGPIDHVEGESSGVNTDETLKLVFKYTVTDIDGDADSGYTTVYITDDEPVASWMNKQISEADLGDTVTGTLNFDGGADGATVIDVKVDRLKSITIDGVTYKTMYEQWGDAPYTSAGELVALTSIGSLETDGSITYTGTAVNSGETVFTFTIYSDGSYEYTQQRPFDNTNAIDSDGLGLPVHFKYTIQDADGDTDDHYSQFYVVDDTPEMTSNNGIAQNAIVTETYEGVDSTVASLKVNYGADEFGTVVFTGEVEGYMHDQLTSNGVLVTYEFSEDGKTVTAKAGAEVIFTATMNENGTSYTVELFGEIDHATPSETTNRDDGQSINFPFIATDYDGDSIESSLSVRIIDDVPVITIEDFTSPMAEENNIDAGNSFVIDILALAGVDGLSDDATVSVDAIDPSQGALSVNSNNEIVYSGTPSSANFNGTVMISYTVTDGDGDIVTGNFELTVNPNNDTPYTVSSLVVDGITEDDDTFTLQLLDSGLVGDIDGDDLDVVSNSIAISAVDGEPVPDWTSENLGIVYSLNAETGELTIDPAQFNYLKEGESITFTIEYDVKDPSNATTSNSAKVTINGVNDAASIITSTTYASGVFTGIPEINEGTDVSKFDYDTPNNTTTQVIDRGEFGFNGTSASVIMNGTLADFDKGVQYNDAFAITLKDGETLEVSIDNGNVYEIYDSNYNLVVGIPTGPEEFIVVVHTQIDGTQGSNVDFALTLNIGNITDSSDFGINSTDETGETTTNYLILNGDLVESSLPIVVDRSEFSVVDNDTIAHVFKGNVGSANSGDTYNDAFGFKVGAGEFGSLSFVEDNNSEYALYKFNEDTRTWEVVTPTPVTFGQGDYIVRIESENDTQSGDYELQLSVFAPNIAYRDYAVVTEDSAETLTTSGILGVEDPDRMEDSFTEAIITTLSGGETALGTLSINAQGQWIYEIDNSLEAVQGLKDDESFTETFTVSTVDGTTHDISITVNGTSELPTISIDTESQVKELLINGDFETGNFNGWNAGIDPTRSEGGNPYYFTSPNGWVVATNPANPFAVVGLNGFSAFNSFDGGVLGFQDRPVLSDPTRDDLRYFLEQDFSIGDDVKDLSLSFSFQVEGGVANTVYNEPRTFLVNILDENGNTLDNLYRYELSDYQQVRPVNDINLDLSDFYESNGAGDYTLQFLEIVPQYFTGGATFVIDDISLQVDNETTTLYVSEDTEDTGIDMVLLLNAAEEGTVVQSIDEIDLSSDDHILSNLTLEDFVSITDDDNELKISGEAGDIVKLDLDVWTPTATDAQGKGIDISGDGYVEYEATYSTASGDQALKLLIDQDVTVQDV